MDSTIRQTLRYDSSVAGHNIYNPPLIVDKQIIDGIYGTILGSACANSLGGSCIGLNRREIVSSLGVAGLRDFSVGLSRSFVPNHRPGALLADTFLALELAESIIEYQGQLDENDLESRLSKLLENDEFLLSAPGAPCLAAIRRRVDELPPVDGNTSEAVDDNAAVRAYPLGCLPDKFDRIDYAVRQAKLTHADTRVAAAAAVLTDSISFFIAGNRLNSEVEVRAYVRREFELASKIDSRFAQWWDDVAPDLDYTHPAHELPYSLLNVESNVNESIPTAVGIFLIFRHSLEEAVCQAACAGGATDSISTVVGALSGAYHGLSSVPKHWIDKLAHRKRLEAIAEGLTNLW